MPPFGDDGMDRGIDGLRNRGDLERFFRTILGTFKVGTPQLLDKSVTSAKLASGVLPGGPPTGAAGGVLSGTYPNPGFAADMATQAELDAGLATNATADRARANHTGTQALATISDAGTAASRNVPASGDASATEVVKGNDTRLTNSRAPSGAAGGVLAGTYPNPSYATDPLARANHTGTQAQSTVTNLASDLAAKAPLASPTFTGTPLITTTPTAGDSSHKIPDTAFVEARAQLAAAGLRFKRDVTFASIAALPAAYTISGSGSTLTSNSNIAFDGQLATAFGTPMNPAFAAVGLEVLLQHQADSDDNGIWRLTQVGVLTTQPFILQRRDDMAAGSAQFAGAVVTASAVGYGFNDGKSFVLTADVPSVGTDGQVWGVRSNYDSRVSSFIATLLDDPNAATAMATLGVADATSVAGLTALSLNANWSTSTGFSAASYYRDRGRVHVQGAITRGAAGTNLLAPFSAALPAGSRPTQTGGAVMTALQYPNAVTFVSITTGGVIGVGAATNAIPIFLDGLSFRI